MALRLGPGGDLLTWKRKTFGRQQYPAEGNTGQPAKGEVENDFSRSDTELLESLRRLIM
jgi:hypothetical protein